ncbi:MAG: EutN/CcmL family microcompartment protein [Lachnospiraceae bacterium]|nr:EutN/CcmL family microcompartment protein [Lachnospiraceae bacterium]
MLICKVTGHIWATKKEENLEGLKLMVVQQVDSAGNPLGDPFVAADVVGAGIGEEVITVSGSTARRVFKGETAPVDAVIVGIIDSIEVEREAEKAASSAEGSAKKPGSIMPDVKAKLL